MVWEFGAVILALHGPWLAKTPWIFCTGDKGKIREDSSPVADKYRSLVSAHNESKIIFTLNIAFYNIQVGQ